MFEHLKRHYQIKTVIWKREIEDITNLKTEVRMIGVQGQITRYHFSVTIHSNYASCDGRKHHRSVARAAAGIQDGAVKCKPHCP